MTVRWLCVLGIISLLALGGCGSSTSPVLIAGDYFPIPPVNTVWTYGVDYEAEVEYTAVAGVGGSANAVESIYHFAAALPASNLALDGRGRVLYKDGVGVFGSDSGFETTDFSATLTSGDDTGQVTSASYLTGIGPVFPFP